MADISVDGNLYISTASGQLIWGPYWSDGDTAVVVIDNNVSDPTMVRTTDRGANWSTTVIQLRVCQAIGCWFDKETPGDTGTLLHVAYSDSTTEIVYYVTIDVSDGTIGTIREIATSITSTAAPASNQVLVSKAVNGTVMVAWTTTTSFACQTSTDNFATNNDTRGDCYEDAAATDFVLLFPANVADGDMGCIFMDKSANAVTVKMFDSSADTGTGTWTETAIEGSIVENNNFINMGVAVRHSDNHVILALHTNDDISTDDLHVWDITPDSIASPGVTALTDVFTNQGESSGVCVLVDQNNDDLFIAYLKGGTFLSLVDVVGTKSSDGGSTWDTETTINEDATDDFRHVSCGHTIDASAGGHFLPLFYNDDLTEVFVNTNNIDLTSGGGTAAPAVLLLQD